MRCSRCQHENSADAAFCDECGVRLETACPNCGEPNRSGAKFCRKCGQGLAQATGASHGSPSNFNAPESYTPKHLAEKILTSKTALEGERKQVTVLFADLKGSMELLADRDPEEARKLLDPVLTLMMDAVHRYEGTVNQVMGDGIMALFGAPLAHEDHAVRACYAALRMQESVKRYAEEVFRSDGVTVRIRIGLNSGEVVVRAIGSDLHMDYTAVGQTTHLAARMEQLADPGTTLLAASTLQLAEGHVEVKTRGAVPVKGLSTPVEVYELAGAGIVRSRLQAAMARGLTRFVGRDGELDQLRQALERAGTGHGQAVAVVGEPGVGKSRLYWEFTHSHRTQGWLILESGSVSYGKATPYLPVLDLLKHYFQIDARDDPRRIREKVTGKLLSLDRALEPSIPALLSLLDVPLTEAVWDRLDPPQRRQRILDGVKRLLLRESQVQPLLVVFEDLQWVDSETQAVLDGLVDGLANARVLLLVNYRPEYRHGWSSKSYYTQLRVDALSTESAEELLHVLLGTDTTLKGLEHLLIQQTEGNPFFLEESMRGLVETRALAGAPGAYRLAQPLQGLQIPPTVQAILAARIDRLPPENRRLLLAAAVIGKDVPFVLLDAIADQDEAELRRGLAQLQAAEFLYEARLFPDLEYTFKHALTHEVAYGSLLQERRRVLHARVLESLERLFADRVTERVELLAHHAERGEQWAKAARYLYLSGERALAYARYDGAASLYDAAIQAIDRQGGDGDLSLKLDAYLELYVTRFETSEGEDLPALAEKADALASALNDTARLARVRLRQAQEYVITTAGPGGLEVGMQKATEALELADHTDVRTRSYAHLMRALTHRHLGQLGEAITEFEAGAAVLAGFASQPEEEGLVLPIHVTVRALQAETYAVLGEFDSALAAARDGLRIAGEIKHVPSLALASAQLGYVQIQRGDVESALPVLENGLAIGEEHSFPRGIVLNALYLAQALLLLGRREEGLTTLRRALEAPRPSGYFTQWAMYGAVTATAYLAAGQLAEAQAEIDHGLALATSRKALGRTAPLLCLQADLLSRPGSGTAEEAVRRWGEAMTLATALGMRPLLGHCHLGLGQLYRRTSTREQAREHLTTATTMYRAMDMRFWLKQAEAELRELGA